MPYQLCCMRPQIRHTYGQSCDVPRVISSWFLFWCVALIGRVIPIATATGDSSATAVPFSFRRTFVCHRRMFSIIIMMVSVQLILIGGHTLAFAPRPNDLQRMLRSEFWSIIGNGRQKYWCQYHHSMFFDSDQPLLGFMIMCIYSLLLYVLVYVYLQQPIPGILLLKTLYNQLCSLHSSQLQLIILPCRIICNHVSTYMQSMERFLLGD